MTTPASLAITHHFASLKDPRVNRTLHHQLIDILTIALCATLADCDSWNDIEDFGHDHHDWFRTFLDLPSGIPSHDTFNRVFAALDPHAFQDCFTNWINALCSRLKPSGYQIDGKAHRGSVASGKSLGCLHTVSVWASEHGISLGQVAVADKSNEITAIPELLRMLQLEGALVSIDAMGCQKEIAATVLAQGGDYLLQVKENQPTLHQDITQLVEKAMEEDFAGPQYQWCSSEEVGHGRKERRTYMLLTDVKGLGTREEWAGLQAVVVVTRERQVGEKTSLEQSYYISSRSGDVQTLARSIRSHWGIENGLHWVMDVIFGEDANRTRTGNAGENLGWLRRVALTLLKQEESPISIRRKRKRASRSTAFLEKLLRSLSEK